MDHSPHWLNRKFWQAVKEKKDVSRQRVIEGAQSLFILADSLFNQGRGAKEILSPEGETVRKREAKQSKYVTNTWWKPESQ